jgi:hypothetical protein
MKSVLKREFDRGYDNGMIDGKLFGATEIFRFVENYGFRDKFYIVPKGQWARFKRRYRASGRV